MKVFVTYWIANKISYGFVKEEVPQEILLSIPGFHYLRSSYIKYKNLKSAEVRDFEYQVVEEEEN